MSLRTDLVTYLKAGATLAALISGRLAPWKASQNQSLPYVAYTTVGVNRPQLLAGGRLGLTQIRLQFDCFAATELSAAAVATALGDLLDGAKGTCGTTRVLISMLDDETDDNEAPAHGDEGDVYRKTLDVTIWFHENVPAPTLT